ncbi:MAG: TMEM165/GDT1 family protein [Proteobacteria bacterium]|nr:TMEM165/GDT1 family protein [Pseudomonadota bacterium]
MEALVTSTVIVALAEIGDKTQLLSFVLAAKLKRKYAIMVGIFVATLANHTLAGYVGAWLAGLLSPLMLKWIIASSFFAFGLWVLRPDTLESDPKLHGRGAFVATLIAFFFVEMGDKTQLATVALAARYDALVAVIMGTTLGMLIANAPAVWIGAALAHRINMKAIRWIAAASFLALGVWTLASGGVRLY